MSQLTVFLARLIGLFSILIVAGLMIRAGSVVETILADGPVMLVYAVISLGLGLGMILAHNKWSGAAPTVVVTLVGWLILAKGILLLCLAPETFTRLLAQIHYGAHFSLFLMAALMIGLYLTWAGFSPTTPKAP